MLQEVSQKTKANIIKSTRVKKEIFEEDYYNDIHIRARCTTQATNNSSALKKFELGRSLDPLQMNSECRVIEWLPFCTW